MPKARGIPIPPALAAQTLSTPYGGNSSSGSGGADLTAQYLVLAADTLLTSERVFTPGSGLNGVDGGAGGAYTLNLNTPGTLSAVSTNSAGGNHTHAVTSSSNPGAAASLLSSDVSGGLTLSGVLRLNSTLDFGGDVDLARKGANVLELSTGDSFESLSYTSGVAGWHIGADGSAEFQNVRVRGEIAASVFRISEISATAGTFGVFYSAGEVYSDYTAPGSVGSSNTLTARNSAVGASLFATNDVLRIKSFDGTAVRDLWFLVTAVGTNAGDNTSYTVKLESGTTGVTFKAGTAIADYGPSGSGFITLSADGTVGSSANLTIADHAGSPWSATTLRVRLGNLNGTYDVGSHNYYGIGIGDYAGGAGNFLRYDSSDGFKIQVGGGDVTLDSNGITLSTGTGYTNAINWYDTGSSYYATQIYTSYGSGLASLQLNAQGKASTDTGIVEIVATNNSGAGQESLFYMQAGGSPASNWASFSNGGGSSTFSGLTIGAESAPNAMLDVRGSADITGGLNVGTATGAASGQLKGTILDANSGQTGGLVISHRSTGTPAASFGVPLSMRGDDSTNVEQDLFKINAVWATATHGSQAARAVFLAYDATSSRECLRLESSGTAPMVGFFGATAVAQQSVGSAAPAGGTGTAAGGWDTAAHRDAAITLLNNIRTALQNLGLSS